MMFYRTCSLVSSPLWSSGAARHLRPCQDLPLQRQGCCYGCMAVDQ